MEDIVNTTIIDKSFNIIEENDYIDGLNQIYSRVPSGECNGCGTCCGESVRTHFVEFLNIYKYLVDENKLTKELKSKIMTFYFTELTEVRPCPFREEEGCLIYPVRPLVCRLFGHLSETEHNGGIDAIHAENEDAAEYMEDEYGLKIPNEVIFKTIPYCKSFKPEYTIEQEERIELSTSLLMMDSEFFKEGLLDDYHMHYGLVQWFVDLWLDEEEVDDLRIQIAKELLKNGYSTILKELVDKK